MPTIQVTAKGINESLKVRCNLNDAASSVEVDYMQGRGWTSTQYQCGNTRHTWKGLAALGENLLSEALQESEIKYEWQVVN